MRLDDDYYFKADSYNHKRIKTKLKGLSPVQYKTKSFQQLFGVSTQFSASFSVRIRYLSL